MMNRNRSSEGDNSITVQLANCLMLLSSSRDSSMISNRVFTCKTCERQFTSFQALGGHRASHKKPRLTVVAGGGDQPPPPSSPAKQKIHECSVCGLEFPIGQALGGHMRRHRSSAINITNNNNNNNNVVDDDHDPIKQLIMSRTFLSLSPPPDVKKLMPNNMRRSALCLDLNLTPLENKFVFGRLVRAPSHVDFI